MQSGNAKKCTFLCIILFFLISLSYQQDVPVEVEVVEFVESDNDTEPIADEGIQYDNNTSSTSETSDMESYDQLYKSQKRSLEELYHFYQQKHLIASPKDKANEILILDDGDPFYILATDKSGCMFVMEDNIPPSFSGTQNYNEICDPSANPASDPSLRCKLYTMSRESKDSKSPICLKPTHLICDPTIKRCACGNEGYVIPEIRFQFGDYEWKNHKEGRCFIRPTFDYIPGIECSPGTIRKELAVEEEADSIPICACESDADFYKFDSSDKLWWKCIRENDQDIGMASFLQPERASIGWFLLTVMNGRILLSF